MGEIYEASCSCGFKTKLQLGAGMNACNINFIINLLEKADADKLMKAKEENRIKKIMLTNEAYLCKDCKAIGSVYVLTYQLHSGETIKVTGTCNRCNNTVDILSQDNIICPECGQSIRKNMVGHWD